MMEITAAIVLFFVLTTFVIAFKKMKLDSNTLQDWANLVTVSSVISAVVVGLLFGAWTLIKPSPSIPPQPSPSAIVDQSEDASATITKIAELPTQTPTETPLPDFPTMTPTPRIPDTDTPYPTPVTILEPAATVLINTLSDSILDVGQSWRQDDLLLTLSEVNYNPNFPESECDISFSFYIESIGSSVINVSAKSSQFQAVDNLGRPLQQAGFSQMSVCPAAHINEPFSGIVEPGKRFPSSGFDYWQTGFTVNLTDTAIDYIIVTANGLYHFNNAKWRIPINN